MRAVGAPSFMKPRCIPGITKRLRRARFRILNGVNRTSSSGGRDIKAAAVDRAARAARGMIAPLGAKRVSVEDGAVRLEAPTQVSAAAGLLIARHQRIPVGKGSRPRRGCRFRVPWFV